MSFIISTTGNIASVSFPELGKVFTHPISAYDLESEFAIETILGAKSILNAIENNWILAVYNGQVLPLPQPSIGGGAVDSVFGRTGVVTAQTGDYTTSQVTEGTNLYFTDARVIAALPSQTGNNGKYLTTDGSLLSWATVISGSTWGSITGTLSSQTDLQSALDNKVTKNGSITGATKTKITYDSKGLVTAGADATTSDIAEGSNLYYTDTRARLAISETITGLDYDNTTGVFSLTTGYTIPTTLQLASYLTANQTITLSNEASGSGTTSINVTLNNLAVIGKVLTGFTSGAGVITSSDSILSAIQKVDGNVAAIPQQHSYVSATFDGAGGVISVNSTTVFIVPYTGTITEWTLLETSSTPVSSSIVIDAWKDTYANYPPTALDTIFGTKPSLSSAIKNQATGLSIPVTEGELIKLNVDSVSSALKVKLIFKIVRS